MPDEPPRVLVDTNVWISAFINPDGAPARILQAFFDGRYIPVTSKPLMEEIHEVVSRPRIRRRCRFTDDDVTAFLALVVDRAVETFPTGTLHLCRDPDDDIILETAILGDAQFAVSRDDDIKRDPDLMQRLRERGVEVVSVAQFLRLLDARS